MQFVINGPDIPDELLQAHEEGNVVFFCGAGISYPAGLPDFKGLVDKIYEHAHTTPSESAIEQQAYDKSQYDVTLNLLEHRLPGHRLTVRSALFESLQPKLRRKGATDTHRALLRLARTRNDTLRLVTTNFDRIFEKVIQRDKIALSSFCAPLLPVPKKTRWNGLVYLHGLLPEKKDGIELNKLVMTSGDFGLAYLTERWAARFVSELFRNYIVCFIGYSVDDPVMRYMMDALAADRMQGEATPQAYALGSYTTDEKKVKTEWEAKGVTPILYKVSSGKNRHQLLHKTLVAWAETYRDGISGRESIVAEHALTSPSSSTKQDNFVGRMQWALTDKSGLPAKRFADFNPAPSLSWLEVFSEDAFRHKDLPRFDIQHPEAVDEKLSFSLVRRPTPYTHAPWMILASGGLEDSRWDAVMHHLGRWLSRHINDPKLVYWILKRGSHIHDRLSTLIEYKIDELTELEKAGNTSELDKIRLNAPNAIPDEHMRTIWRLFFTGRVKSSGGKLNFFDWRKRLNLEGLTTTTRMQLREILSPKIKLREPFHWDGENTSDSTPKSLKQLVDWELVLEDDHIRSSMRNINDKIGNHHLAALFEDIQSLLRDALDILKEMGEATEQRDSSMWHLPSISEHWQNRGFRDWIVLIELLRDSWIEIKMTDSDKANRIAINWFNLPYLTFKRLALFAASQDDCIQPEVWCEWLTSDNGWCLWAMETQRETMRLLALQGKNISTRTQNTLESTIVAGPSRSRYKDRKVWLRLAKLNQSGLELGSTANSHLNNLSASNLTWNLSPHEHEEFHFWHTGTGSPDYEESRQIDIAPNKRRPLIGWLKKPGSCDDFFHENNWRELCGTRFFLCLSALHQLSIDGKWPIDCWREALQVWGEDARIQRSWKYAAGLIHKMPDNIFGELIQPISWWLQKVPASTITREELLLDLCRRIMGIPDNDDTDSDDPVSSAINHPIGHMTQTLLNVWFRTEPNDNDKLPDSIKTFFTDLCDIKIKNYRHGRVILASRLIALFRVDQAWSEHYLMPLFSWHNDVTEAKNVWEGFLWTARIYPPLLIAIKTNFLDTANRYDELGDYKRQYASFLTYTALTHIEGYTVKDFRDAFSILPQAGLNEAAQELNQALGSSGPQREEYFDNRILPFWNKIWPKSCDLASKDISESLARMCINAGRKFPSALETIIVWIQPVDYPELIVYRLHKSELSRLYPKDALRLLDALIDNQQGIPTELSECLSNIIEARPELAQDHCYQRLLEYSRR